MKFVRDLDGNKLTKLDLAYQLLKFGGNFDKYIVYYTLVDKFSYKEIADEWYKRFGKELNHD